MVVVLARSTELAAGCALGVGLINSEVNVG
jgi:hypothetical protein